MTTPQMGIFNPAIGANVTASKTKDKEKENKEYPTTGNSTRDQCRKLIYEAY
jgi:hypothetical protein